MHNKQQDKQTVRQSCDSLAHRDDAPHVPHLFEGNTPGQQLDEISGTDDGVRVVGFLCGANGHTSLNQVQRGFDVLQTEHRLLPTSVSCPRPPSRVSHHKLKICSFP